MTLSRRRHPLVSAAWRWFVLLFCCALGLQIFFMGRIAMMRFVDPSSTAFQRSEIWRIFHKSHVLHWSQRWVANDKLPTPIQRAVIAS